MSALAEQGANGPRRAATPPETGQPHGSGPPRTPRRRGWLIAALVTAGVVAAAATVGIVAVTNHRHPPAPHPLRDTVFTLRPGQCFNASPNGIDHADPVPCRQPHGGEIYGAFGVASRRWPGSHALAAQAHAGCLTRLSSYINPQLATNGMTLAYIYPDQGAWDTGTRTVICEIRSTGGKLTGSVRAFTGTGR